MNDVNDIAYIVMVEMLLKLLVLPCISIIYCVVYYATCLLIFNIF